VCSAQSVAVRYEVRTGIHPEGQALSLRDAFIVKQVFQLLFA